MPLAKTSTWRVQVSPLGEKNKKILQITVTILEQMQQQIKPYTGNHSCFTKLMQFLLLIPTTSKATYGSNP